MSAVATLLCSPPPPAHRTAPATVTDEPSTASAGARGGLVLLVEDDPEIRAIFGSFLRHAGYDVVAATDAPAALAALRERDGRLDLLITDVTLPWMSGHELGQLLRERDPGLRILFVSGDGAPDTAPGATASTVHLAKPLTRSVLLTHVQALLGPAGRTARS